MEHIFRSMATVYYPYTKCFKAELNPIENIEF